MKTEPLTWPTTDMARSYSSRYWALREAVLATATASWEVLDCTMIQLVSGLFKCFDRVAGGGPTVSNGREALRFLYDAGSIHEVPILLPLATTRFHDVVLGLALHEIEVEHFLLGAHADEFGWASETACAIGARAAQSADECLVWARELKDQWMGTTREPIPNAAMQQDGLPVYWIFRPATRDVPEWRRPRIVWVHTAYGTSVNPSARRLEPNSAQLAALTSALHHD
jgi:hypothetical protein